MVFYNTLTKQHQGVRKNAARVVDQDVSPSVENAIIILLAGCSKGHRCVPKEAVIHRSQPMSVLRRSLGRQICSSERSPLPVDPCGYQRSCHFSTTIKVLTQPSQPVIPCVPSRHGLFRCFPPRFWGANSLTRQSHARRLIGDCDSRVDPQNCYIVDMRVFRSQRYLEHHRVSRGAGASQPLPPRDGGEPASLTFRPPHFHAHLHERARPGGARAGAAGARGTVEAGAAGAGGTLEAGGGGESRHRRWRRGGASQPRGLTSRLLRVTRAEHYLV